MKLALMAAIAVACNVFAQDLQRSPCQDAAIVFEQYLARLKVGDFNGAQKFWNKAEASRCQPADWILTPPNDLQQEIQARRHGFDHQIVDCSFHMEGLYF